MDRPPDADLMARLRAEADGCHRWSSGAGDIYPEHRHGYQKVLYCERGSISVRLAGRELRLGAGERMVLPAGTSHSAVVGPDGCVCLEGRGRNMAAG